MFHSLRDSIFSARDVSERGRTFGLMRYDAAVSCAVISSGWKT